MQPLQVFSVLELDPATIPGGYGYDRFRDEFAIRVRAIPALREKLSDTILNLDHPLWVEDRDFDIDRHVHRISLRAPGGRAELGELTGRLAGLPLDRSRPLWEMWVVEGFGDPDDGARLAVLLKVHHAAADGVTYANLLVAAVRHRTGFAGTGTGRGAGDSDLAAVGTPRTGSVREPAAAAGGPRAARGT